MKKFIIIFIMLLQFIINLFAESSVSVKTFFKNEEIKKVLQGEIVSRMCIKDNASKENTDLKIDVPKTKYANEDFSIYEVVVDEKAFIPFSLEKDSSKLKFYNILTAYSKLKGMKYYSRMRKRIETFILDSNRIDPENYSNINDKKYNNINAKTENYFYQKDNKFGKLKFKSELYNDGNNFIMINTCIQPVSKLLFLINKKNETKFISFFIYSKENQGFFYYTFNVMRVRLKFMLTKNDIMTLNPTLFSSRLRASTVHLAKEVGLNWDDKLNPWDEDLLEKGVYKNY